MGQTNPPIATGTDFLALCSKIGEELMTSPDLDKVKAQERSLGYGNKANLVLFPHNTPAQTLTCIWASGEYNGAPWVPLFPRRKKV